MKDFESGCSRFRSPETERGGWPSDAKSDMKDDKLNVEVGRGKSNCWIWEAGKVSHIR